MSLGERITDIYWGRARRTGLGEARSRALRGDLSRHIADCVRFFGETAPEEIERIERMTTRYDRLRRAAGINRRFLEEPSKLLPGALGHLQALAEAVFGALPAFLGFFTGAVPCFVTRAYARRVAGAADMERDAPPLGQPLVGILPFFLFYGGVVALTAWRFSGQATVLLAVLLIPTGLFARAYARRMRTIVAHVGDRTASWLKLGAVARVREARYEIIGEMDVLRNRYREQALGWEPLPTGATRPGKRAAALRVSWIVGLVAITGLFLSVYVDQPVEGLPLGPSPWQSTRASNPELTERELTSDARGVVLIAAQLDRLQHDMMLVHAEFKRGERNLLTQADHDRIKQILIAYLDLRTALLSILWRYHPDDPGAIATTQDPLEARAFLTAYAAGRPPGRESLGVVPDFQNRSPHAG